jgi:hypothetical protein
VKHSDRPLAKSDKRGPIDETADRLRRACVWLASASVLIAGILALGVSANIDPEGIPPLAWLVAALLVASRLWWSEERLERVADFFGTIGLMWLTSAACGTIAMLGLRLHRPLADAYLHAADRALFVDGITIVTWLVARGQWIFTVMSQAYLYTIAALVLSMIALALTGNRIEAWRAAFTFIGSLLLIVLIAMLMPAKGLGMWAPPSLLAHLPDHAMRYFWPSFDAFYSGRDPVLRMDAIDAVVSFPSFHTAMGLITVAMWRHSRLIFPVALTWLAFMLLATFPYGGHYVVDILGGAAVWAMWFVLSRRLEAKA